MPAREYLLLHHRRETPQPAKEEEEKPCENIPGVEANTETRALARTTTTSVWGRLFLGRRVRPESAGSRASAARSAAPR